MRYIEAAATNQLQGGWFDGYDGLAHLNNFVEQATLTLVGGAKEVCFYNLGDLLTDFKVAASLRL